MAIQKNSSSKHATSKWHRVAVSGPTADGRVIDAKQLREMAETYNPDVYGARINVEHCRSITPDWLPAMGDVISLRAEEVEILGEKQVALYAQLDPNEDLLRWNKRRQKVYTSVEIDSDFRGGGKAYLMGLAVTDSPASIGTEMLQFSRAPLAQRPGNMYSSLIETSFDFADDPDDDSQDEGKGMIATFAKAFASALGKSAPAPAPVAPAPTPAADQYAAVLEFVKTLASSHDAMAKRLGRAESELERLRGDYVQDVREMSNKLNSTQAFGTQRPPATGNTSSSLGY